MQNSVVIEVFPLQQQAPKPQPPVGIKKAAPSSDFVQQQEQNRSTKPAPSAQQQSTPARAPQVSKPQVHHAEVKPAPPKHQYLQQPIVQPTVQPVVERVPQKQQFVEPVYKPQQVDSQKLTNYPFQQPKQTRESQLAQPKERKQNFVSWGRGLPTSASLYQQERQAQVQQKALSPQRQPQRPVQQQQQYSEVRYSQVQPKQELVQPRYQAEAQYRPEPKQQVLKSTSQAQAQPVQRYSAEPVLQVRKHPVPQESYQPPSRSYPSVQQYQQQPQLDYQPREYHSQSRPQPTQELSLYEHPVSEYKEQLYHPANYQQLQQTSSNQTFRDLDFLFGQQERVNPLLKKPEQVQYQLQYNTDMVRIFIF